jgi:type VI secretion system secreted protein VgrG
MPDGTVSQRTRLGKFHSPLGPDALALVRFAGDEGINRLGSFRVDVLSSAGLVDLDRLLGLHGTVEIVTLQHGPRFYDGLITEAELVEERADGWLLQLEMRPWFWLAGLRRNQRIFHNKTAPQIIAEVLGDYRHPQEARLQHSYTPIEYTVQYGESDLAFVCRMMERHGISYHFEHALAGHVMVLTDAPESFRPAPGNSRIFHPVTRQHRIETEHFSVWSSARRVNTGRVKLTDYNFKTPTAAMQVDQSGGAQHAEGDIESFDYPGHYLAQSKGRGVARLRAEQDRALDGVFQARGDATSLSPGMLVTLTGHPDTALNGQKYLLRDAAHSFVAEAYASSAAAAQSEDDSYKGTYTFHPAATPFQPPMVTPLARIFGPQTAQVVGEGEIDCDEYGRILVRFHWDLVEAHSMRCRVAQIWAGNGWGGMVIPRIGMEVVVEFLEGDPDKPLVTGCVYNGKNKVPYSLPEHKSRSTFRTDTHQGSGSNELRFEDQAGAEEVFMHAQKDHNTIIENDETHAIGHDRTKTVANDQAEVVGHDKTINVGNDHTETIARDMTYKVGRNQIESYAKDHVHRVGNIHKQSIFADHLHEVGRNFESEVAGKYSLDVGTSITNNTAKHTLMAFEKMQVMGPGGKITIDASGITLEAATIRLKGNVIMGGSGSAQVPTLQLAANQGLPLCEECTPAPEKA